MNFTYRLIPYIFVNLKGNSIDSILKMLVIFTSLNLQKVRKGRHLGLVLKCVYMRSEDKIYIILFVCEL